MGAQILRDQNATKIRLLTNNTVKRTGLEGYGIEIVETIPLVVGVNKYNKKYLKTKADRMGHNINLD